MNKMCSALDMKRDTPRSELNDSNGVLDQGVIGIGFKKCLG